MPSTDPSGTTMSTTPPRLRLDANLKWLFTEVPFEARFEAAAAAGFTAVEFPSPYGHRPEELAKLLADAGLRSVLINTPAGDPGGSDAYGIACHPGRGADFRAQVEQALRYATKLGTGVIHVMGGLRPPGVGSAEALGTYVTNLAWAAEYAADTNVTLLIEVLNQRDAPGFVLECLETAAAVVSAIGSERLRLLFDLYHCQVSQGDVTTRLHELMPIIGHVQIADPPTRTEPGTGELGWDHLFGRLRAEGYTGWVGCEYAPTTDTMSSLRWRHTFGRHLAG
ncbi:TIM barrel protein [Saccharomonospora sp. NPDC046836]|uniref:hydroxypyruvate isomerase family protein n=1 Tax=Saccharomonospora sp. NPDC046836 TaxID=3156921 RepID=UPI0033D0E5DC